MLDAGTRSARSAERTVARSFHLQPRARRGRDSGDRLLLCCVKGVWAVDWGALPPAVIDRCPSASSVGAPRRPQLQGAHGCDPPMPSCDSRRFVQFIEAARKLYKGRYLQKAPSDMIDSRCHAGMI